MFNGIIFNRGKVDKIVKRNKGINLFIKSNLLKKSKDLGMSVSCDGVCLTLISIKNKNLEFYLSNETLNRTKFNKIKKGDIINLELPLKNIQKISGHICQGHVDYVSRVKKIKLIDKSYLMEFSAIKKDPENELLINLGINRANKIKNYLVKKGISEDRLSTFNHDASQPVSASYSELSLAKNRRVEFKIVD